MSLYMLMIVIGIALNFWHPKALVLTFIVGMGVVMPITREHGAGVWYAICASIEVTVLFSALLLRSTISFPIGALSLLFIFVHVVGYIFKGSSPDSPYHYFAQSIEYTELLACILMSPTVVHYIKGKVKCLQKF